MNTEVWPPGPPSWTTLRPGPALRTSGSVRCWRAAMSAAVTTVTLLAFCSSGVGTRVALTTTACSSSAVGALSARLSDQAGEVAHNDSSAARANARRASRPVDMARLLKMHTPVPAGSWHLQKLGARQPGGRVPANQHRPPRRHRLTREAGLRALELECSSLRADRLPAPDLGAVAHVIRLISITVAGAAPALDESAPDFPF